jgi:hypothetical protein
VVVLYAVVLDISRALTPMVAERQVRAASWPSARHLGAYMYIRASYVNLRPVPSFAPPRARCVTVTAGLHRN